MTIRQDHRNRTHPESAEIGAKQVSRARQKAIDWLLHSGIQDKQKGGVYAWFDSREKQYAFLYPEITGYAISEFLFLYETEKNPIFLDRAVQAADWILREAWNDRAKSIPFRIYRGEPLSPSYGYTFDSGMVLSGLTQLAALTGEKRCQEVAVQIGDWISQTMLRPEGGFFCFWDSRQRIRCSSPDKWSTTPWAFLTKVARSLAELGKLTQNQRYSKLAMKVCEWGMNGQSADGRYRILDNSQWVVSHPFLYAVEGLFLCGRFLERSDFLASAQQGLRWLSEKRTEDGMILAELGERREPYQVRSDVQAQFIRMALLIPPPDLRPKGPIAKLYPPSVDKSGGGIMPEASVSIGWETVLEVLRGLLFLQNSASSTKSEGGFQFAIDLEQRVLEHSNAWCTLFAIQALSLAEEWLVGEVSKEKTEAVIRFFV